MAPLALEFLKMAVKRIYRLLKIERLFQYGAIIPLEVRKMTVSFVLIYKMAAGWRWCSFISQSDSKMALML